MLTVRLLELSPDAFAARLREVGTKSPELQSPSAPS